MLSTEIKHENQDTVFDYSLLLSVNKFPASKVMLMHLIFIKSKIHMYIEQKYKTCTFIHGLQEVHDLLLKKCLKSTAST